MARDVDDTLFEKTLRATGVAVIRVEREASPATAGSVLLYEVRFKLDADDGTSVLAILKGLEDGRRVVGFVGGIRLQDVLIALGHKLDKETVRWRDDRPWGESGE